METLLYFSDASLNSDDDAFVARSSDFLGMEIASKTSVKLSFRGSADRNSVDTATIDVADLEVASNLTFKDISNVINGYLNADKDKLYVIADQANNVYAPGFSGTVTVALAN